ncbi:helix-turn-helix domain-containing protein [Actinoallomurus purpureus]|uniref:helix-turn-helix domain-containing protein n=1 Tax=Actinoallomurus purpureus TaxID=478114 RepID=UPI0020923454|nr:helix-turn-helix domain-containing protein [Actinoallomurus purpureus]MCO6011535.1 helix-turn-helix domain-containing protein [Actinoallomurus purpureus]
MTLTPEQLDEMEHRDIYSLRPEAPLNPDVWILKSDRDVLLAEVRRLAVDSGDREGQPKGITLGAAVSPVTSRTALLTVPEFATEIRVAPSTAWAMVASGEIESIVLGARKSRRIPRQALDEYIAARRAEAKAPLSEETV